LKPIVPKSWYLITKGSGFLIVDSDRSRWVLDRKLQEMDKPEDYEIISRDELYRRLKG